MQAALHQQLGLARRAPARRPSRRPPGCAARRSSRSRRDRARRTWATLRILSLGPTRIGLISFASAASSAPLSDVSSQGCATAVARGRHAFAAAMSRSYFSCLPRWGKISVMAIRSSENWLPDKDAALYASSSAASTSGFTRSRRRSLCAAGGGVASCRRVVQLRPRRLLLEKRFDLGETRLPGVALHSDHVDQAASALPCAWRVPAPSPTSPEWPRPNGADRATS